MLEDEVGRAQHSHVISAWFLHDFQSITQGRSRVLNQGKSRSSQNKVPRG